MYVLDEAFQKQSAVVRDLVAATFSATSQKAVKKFTVSQALVRGL